MHKQQNFQINSFTVVCSCKDNDDDVEIVEIRSSIVTNKLTVSTTFNNKQTRVAITVAVCIRGEVDAVVVSFVSPGFAAVVVVIKFFALAVVVAVRIAAVGQIRCTYVPFVMPVQSG